MDYINISSKPVEASIVNMAREVREYIKSLNGKAADHHATIELQDTLDGIIRKYGVEDRFTAEIQTLLGIATRIGIIDKVTDKVLIVDLAPNLEPPEGVTMLRMEDPSRTDSAIRRMLGE